MINRCVGVLYTKHTSIKINVKQGCGIIYQTHSPCKSHHTINYISNTTNQIAILFLKQLNQDSTYIFNYFADFVK